MFIASREVHSGVASWCAPNRFDPLELGEGNILSLEIGSIHRLTILFR